jgi:hypothetical protein
MSERRKQVNRKPGANGVFARYKKPKCGPLLTVSEALGGPVCDKREPALWCAGSSLFISHTEVSEVSETRIEANSFNVLIELVANVLYYFVRS